MTIRFRNYKSGRVGWQVDLGYINGRRRMPTFRSEAEAIEELARHKAELARVGYEGVGLSDGDRVRFLAAQERLAKAGATLDQAVDFYLMHHKSRRGGMLFEQVLELCLQAKEDEGLSDRYIKALRSSVGAFAKAGFGRRPIESILKADIEQWLRSNNWEWKTWNNYRTDVASVFAWAIERQYVSLNPAHEVPIKRKPSDDDDEVTFLKVEDVELMLDRAAKVGMKGRKGLKFESGEEDFRDCLAVAVIGFFCGLRADKELGKMLWRDVREDVVIVTSGRAKSRQRRAVDLPENAREWLRLCPAREGRLVPKNFQRKWKRLRMDCGLFEEWTRSVVRHTFATMHMAHYKDEKQLQALLGHEDASLIFAHYRGVETAANGARFWALRPRLWGLALLLRPEG